MGRIHPILFNTEMVRAILEGRKTVTWRVVKYKYNNTEMKMRTDKYGTCLIEIQKNAEGETYGKNPDGTTWQKLLPYIEKEPPYKKGDILYVREMWAEIKNSDGSHKKYVYKASDTYPFGENGYIVKFCWHPSIHMPKEAARIWLKVTDVRVERLQDITDEQAIREGLREVKYDVNTGQEESAALEWFPIIWNSTIKKADIDRYGWDANPWVWVIEFERCEKPESEGV